ncbi:MAG: type II toxin-antitoxin system HipA family toxin [Gammaproteobacteria bacterium]|nr:type II toxin-antitoxin system HipA family toxin [Gammaproteobacteria bacterium]
MNGERVGTWTVWPGKPDEFAYGSGWLASPDARPISLSLPLRPSVYRGAVVAAYFDNLLPDSPRIRERLQRRFATASTAAFDLLAEVGRDCVGAIQLLPEGTPPGEIRRLDGSPMTSRQIEALLEELPAIPAGPGAADAGFRISLAGAQEKTALLRMNGHWLSPRGTTPSTHILKLPMGTTRAGLDLSTSVENEWLCAQILHEFGVPTAECRIARFRAQKALVVERFDRRPSSDGAWIVRLPVEDLCQALGVPGERKYEADGGPGILAIMGLLLGSSRAEQDRRDFFRTQLLFWMLAAIDGHAKNFSLFLEAGGGYRLTPRYDVLSAFPMIGTTRGKLAAPKVCMAMAVHGRQRHYHWREIQPRHWEEMARRCGMAAGYPAIRDELSERTEPAIAAIARRLPKGYPDDVAEAVFNGLRASREKLAAAAP